MICLFYPVFTQRHGQIKCDACKELRSKHAGNTRYLNFVSTGAKYNILQNERGAEVKDVKKDLKKIPLFHQAAPL